AKTSFGFIIPQEVFFVYVCFYWFGSFLLGGFLRKFLAALMLSFTTCPVLVTRFSFCLYELHKKSACRP
ncbi:MAG: hypothetical protein K2N56_06390, partial [Oscillospiraceae bacterium]|nr:hypothetical protein [Oscillospiraceae bacterium]